MFLLLLQKNKKQTKKKNFVNKFLTLLNFPDCIFFLDHERTNWTKRDQDELA